MPRRSRKSPVVPPSKASGEVLSFKEAVAFLRTSKPSLYRWIAEGRVKAFKVGRQWRFYRQDLVKFLEYEEPTTVGIDLAAVRQAIQVLDQHIARAGKTQQRGGKR